MSEEFPHRIDVHVHFDPHPDPDPRIDRILHILTSLENQQEKLNMILDDLVQKVTALTTVDDSVVALLTDLKAKLDAAIAANDPKQLQALSDAIAAQTTRLSTAVTANTPVVPPVTP